MAGGGPQWLRPLLFLVMVGLIGFQSGSRYRRRHELAMHNLESSRAELQVLLGKAEVVHKSMVGLHDRVFAQQAKVIQLRRDIEAEQHSFDALRNSQPAQAMMEQAEQAEPAEPAEQAEQAEQGHAELLEGEQGGAIDRRDAGAAEAPLGTLHPVCRENGIGREPHQALGGEGGGQADRSPHDLPIYVFVAGVEGAGHHALETVWEALEAHYDLWVVTYNPGLHSFAKDPEVSRAYQFSTINVTTHYNKFRNFLHKPWIRDKKLIIDARNSYPEGFGVGSLAHPDLAYLAHMDGILFDLRVLVLYRDPAACVLSAVRRFKVKEFQYKSFQFQARAIQESLTMINNALALVPCGKTMVLRYEDFVHEPEREANRLAALLSIDPVRLRTCFGGLKKPSGSTKKADDPTVKAQLKEFFESQTALWPILTGAQALPEINPGRARLPEGAAPPEAAGELSAAAAEPDTKGRYLRIKWFFHLGFNNMRFILETALGLAAQLKRQLLVPPRLRMRKCTDEELCRAAPCTLVQEEYWCPISMFLDTKMLQDSGGLVVRDEEAFVKGKQEQFIEDAFTRMYSPDTLFLDVIPGKIARAIDPATQRMREGSQLSFAYFNFQLGCELSYFKVNRRIWNPKNDKNRKQQILSVRREFGASQAQILSLGGTPHHIGLTPIFWSSKAGLVHAQQVWENGVVYHKHVVKFAKHVSERMNELSPTGSYVCMHLRRGDFVEAGWLDKAADLNVVVESVKSNVQSGEAIYLATDEGDENVLKGLREIGARTWKDFKADFTQKAFGQPATFLGFEDYVGLVEQMICANARLFLGSKCSSFTGGILNLRRKLVGDTTYRTVVSKSS